MLTGTFLGDKQTKHKAAEGAGLWSKSEITSTEKANHYASTRITQKQKKHLLKTTCYKTLSLLFEKK